MDRRLRKNFLLVLYYNKCELCQFSKYDLFFFRRKDQNHRGSVRGTSPLIAATASKHIQVSTPWQVLVFVQMSPFLIPLLLTTAMQLAHFIRTFATTREKTTAARDL